MEPKHYIATFIPHIMGLVEVDVCMRFCMRPFLLIDSLVEGMSIHSNFLCSKQH